jgi:hypothetical protein
VARINVLTLPNIPSLFLRYKRHMMDFLTSDYVTPKLDISRHGPYVPGQLRALLPSPVLGPRTLAETEKHRATNATVGVVQIALEVNADITLDRVLDAIGLGVRDAAELRGRGSRMGLQVSRVDAGGLADRVGIVVESDYVVQIYDLDVAGADNQASLGGEIIAAWQRREPFVMRLRIERAPEFWAARVGGMGNWRDEGVADAVFVAEGCGDMRGWIMPWQYHIPRLGIMDA